MANTVAKYQKYAEYKDSGVEWLGVVPTIWKIGALRWKISIASGEGISSLEVEKEQDSSAHIPIIGGNGVMGFSKRVNSVHAIAIGRVGALCGNVHLINYPSWISDNALKISTWNDFIDSFLVYLLKSAKLNDLASKTAQPLITGEQIKSLKVVIPSIEEQKQIANFLDHETAQIDSLIAKQEKLIELLKEKRQAVISHAVTKGLNPHVAMKDSDVEWLGKVPEHWNVLPIKYLTKYVGTGGTPKNQSSFAEVPEINWFTPGDFSGDLKIVDSSKYVTFSSVEDGDSKLYEGKSVLMIGIGATLGKVAISDRDFSCNQQINVLTCNKLINPEFLTFSLMSQLEQIKQLSNSSTIGIINQEKTKQISISVPSVEEQNKIIHFIMGNIEKFNTLINKAESAIQLMQERRTALISSAVTGKIDVRNWQHPNEAKTELSL